MPSSDIADFVVVGTGAGGASCAHVLSAAGYSVILLEEGSYLDTRTRPRHILASMSQAVRDFGTQTTSGTVPIPLLQGKCVGGSTAINCGIIWRMPEDVCQLWQNTYGLDDLLDEHAMERIYARLESDLGVTETPVHTWGGNGHAMAEACARLGLPGKPMRRNTPGCKGSARCLQGCPNAARQSMDVSYVPRALSQGARLYTQARVKRVLIQQGRARGVKGRWVDAQGRMRGVFTMHARRAVILSAGALHTPMIIQQSGIKGWVGHFFRAHPGTPVVARFDRPIGMHQGGTQAYEVPLRERGFKLESLNIPPELLAARIPGAGSMWQERITQLDHFAQWAAMIRMRATGTIRTGWGTRPIVDYTPTEHDLRTARDAVTLLCRMFFAIGAIEVYPGLASAPQVLCSPSEITAIEALPLRPSEFHFVASHLFGGAIAGADPRQSVVGPDLQSHLVPGLYAMDASVFPSNLGVNPQHSIMAVSYRAAERLANQERHQRAA